VTSSKDSRLAAFRGTRAAITGGVGLIGSALARRLVDLGADVLLIDSMVPEGGANLANIAAIRDRVGVETADIRDTAAMWRLLEGQDFLFDLAAQTSHMDSMSAPFHDLEVNTLAQLQLLEACRAVTPEIVIVHAGTRQIYGRPRYIPVDEAHPLRATDVNAVNKTAGEAYHLLYHDVYGLKTRSLRLTNVYGPGMRIKDAKQNFLGIWLRLVLEDRAFEVWGGDQRRDMVFVEDAADAFLAAAVSPETAGKALNVGGDAPYSLAEIAAALIAANGGGRYEIKEFPPERKKIDIGDFVTDDRQFRTLADWAPLTSLAEGLAMSLDYYRRQFAAYL
jgi:nucleoside-diphosphate-sugar epimerase